MKGLFIFFEAANYVLDSCAGEKVLLFEPKFHALGGVIAGIENFADVLVFLTAAECVPVIAVVLGVEEVEIEGFDGFG